MTNGTVLVASPSAIGRQPEASGSSVPAWPARLALNRRFTTETAWVEVMPTGLSSTTQPCTSCFSRLRCPFPSPGTGAARGAVSPASGGDEARFCIFASLIVAGAPEIAFHLRRAQQLLDALRLAEPLVE